MGIEAIIAATSAAEKASRRSDPVMTHRTKWEKPTESAVQELFDELELPYDLTGVSILREYLVSLK